MSIDALKQIYLPSLHLPEVAINWITCVDAREAIVQILSSIPLAQPTCELSSRTMGPIDSQPVQWQSVWSQSSSLNIDSVACRERKTVQSFVASPWADCMASYLLPIKTLSAVKWAEIYILGSSHQHLSDTKADNIFADASLTSNDSAEEPYIDSHPGVVTASKVAVQWTVHRRYGGTASLMMLDRTGWWTDGWSAVGKLDDAMNYSPAISILGVTWNCAVPVYLSSSSAQ
ncbi:hypothetical protein B0H14DRAFT_2576424 [Mycena olivaceomarginata]|nr:hypothetical protein B0H14DRAFT_2576424 [Mycena olivaceomarginata]